MSLKLYFAPGASSLAPLAALEEAGADYVRNSCPSAPAAACQCWYPTDR